MTSQLKVDRISSASGSEVKVSDPLVTDSIMPTFIKKRTPTNNPDGIQGVIDENGGVSFISHGIMLYGGEPDIEDRPNQYVQIQYPYDEGGKCYMSKEPDGRAYFLNKEGSTFFVGYGGDVETGTWTSHNYYIRTNQSIRQTYSADGTISRVVDGQAREIIDAQDIVDLLKGIKGAVNSQTTVEGMRSSLESVSDTLIAKYEDKVKEFVEPELVEENGENL
jgi:hypothetical protein